MRPTLLSVASLVCTLSVGAAGQSAEATACLSGAVPCAGAPSRDSAAGARAVARSLEDNGKVGEALAAYQNAARLAPAMSEVYLDIARLSDELGNHKGALAAYERFVQLEPQESRGHEILGWFFVETAKPEQALRAFRRAESLQPERASVAMGAGIALATLGRHEEALRAFTEAVRRDPADATAWGQMAASAQALKRRREAISYWERALRMSPEYFDGRPAERKEWESAVAAEGVQPPAPLPEPAIAPLRRDTMRHQVAVANGPTSSGSGFYVSHAGFMLTNKHVVQGCLMLRVHGDSGLTLQASTVATDTADDLALLRVDIPSPRVAIFRAGAAVRPGDDVVAVGYPLSGLLADQVNVTTGSISALAGMYNDTHALQMSAPVQPGSSGGPLFDVSGNVVGVVVTKLNARVVAEAMGDIPQNVNFAIKASVARAFLDAHAVAYDLAPSGVARSHADIGEIGRKVTVLIECWK